MVTKKKKNTRNIIDKQFVFNSDNINDIIQKQASGFALPRHMNPWFKNQAGVRRAGLVWAWTTEELEDFARCAYDIHYFANHFCKIKSEDGQIRQMTVRDYQYGVLDAYTKNRFTINMSSRQTGKTVCAAIVLLHYAIFNTNKGIMIVANKAETVVEIIDKIKNIYKLLPFYLKPGIINWNTRTIVFENGCRIKSQARSKEPAIGFTIDFLYMDEFAHIPPNTITHYYKAVVPTVSSIKGSKIVITSTPNGANLFKDLVVGASYDEGHPDKNMYKLIKVYWHQVPDGTFDVIGPDGKKLRGTRFDAKIYPMDHELRNHDLEIEDLEKGLKDMGFMTVVETETHDTGEKQFIRVRHENGVSDIDTVRTLSINGVELIRMSNITNWKEQETKLIGGEEAFNQEYGLQFLAGSKRVLSANIAKVLEERTTQYEFREVEVLDRRLKVDYEQLRFHPEFDETTRNKFHWLCIADVSEGLGLDDSVLNWFRLLPRSKEWLESNKIKALHEAFYYKQAMIYNFNRINHKTDLADFFYLMNFEYLDPQRVKAVVEYNGPGSSFLTALPFVFNQNNQYGNYPFVRYYHNQRDKRKKVGIKVTRNKKELVKSYTVAIESDTLYVDERKTLEQMDSFIKVETKSGDYTYKADSGHDDIVMTLVTGSTFVETPDFKSVCYAAYQELNSEMQKLIDQSMDLNYNPDAISYKNLGRAISKANDQKSGGRYSGGTGRFVRKPL
jgi:hypothetical protein